MTLEQKLKLEFDFWEDTYLRGCNDPFYPDGAILRLVRNHILYYKRQIEETIAPEDYPEIYHRETPKEVPMDYMARPDEIRANAKNSLELYEQDENLKYLMNVLEFLGPAEKEKTCIVNVIGYYQGLRIAIEKDDLVAMRRHENPKGYLESFSECADRVREIKQLESGQQNLLTLMMG